MNRFINGLTSKKGVLLLLLFFTFGLSLFFFGAVFNILVVQENGGKMPFLAQYFHETDTHFSFQSASQVNLFYLTDIIPFNYGGGRYMSSLGDWMVLSGTGLFCASLSLLFVSLNLFLSDKLFGKARK